MKFEELDIRPEIFRAVQDMGFEEATPIQAQAIPVVMTGVDTESDMCRKTEKYRRWYCAPPENWPFRWRKN